MPSHIYGGYLVGQRPSEHARNHLQPIYLTIPVVFGALWALLLVRDFAASRAIPVLLSLCDRVLWLPTLMVGTLVG